MSFNTWMKSNLSADEIHGIAKEGADQGWPQLTEYRETLALYDKYEAEIWSALNEDADNFGYSTPLELVNSFATKVFDRDQLENLLVWYMAERTAREIVEIWNDQLENSDE